MRTAARRADSRARTQRASRAAWRRSRGRRGRSRRDRSGTSKRGGRGSTRVAPAPRCESPTPNSSNPTTVTDESRFKVRRPADPEDLLPACPWVDDTRRCQVHIVLPGEVAGDRPRLERDEDHDTLMAEVDADIVDLGAIEDQAPDRRLLCVEVVRCALCVQFGYRVAHSPPTSASEIVLVSSTRSTSVRFINSSPFATAVFVNGT